MNLKDISKLDEAGARAYLESMRWPDGPTCAHCNSKEVTRLAGKATRPGVFKCRACRKQFTVTVGTIFHRSHLPLRTWLMAFSIMCSAKKGISARQLHRSLGIGSFESAWFMAHRLRHVMRGEPLNRLLSGLVECDEMYVGGKPRYYGKFRGGKRVGPPLSVKTPIVTLVERGGELRALTVKRVTAATLSDALSRNVDMSARLLTDESRIYTKFGRRFAGGHETVQHTTHEYARPPDIHVNTAESFHAMMRRGLYGSFHHVSARHLHRYVDEFVWRWNHRKETDSERAIAALRQADGRRLVYRQVKSGDGG